MQSYQKSYFTMSDFTIYCLGKANLTRDKKKKKGNSHLNNKSKNYITFKLVIYVYLSHIYRLSKFWKLLSVITIQKRLSKVTCGSLIV